MKFLPTNRCGVVGSLTLAGSLVGAVACRSEYDLEPTFCDDWCRATSAPGCEREPADCVTDCELTKASTGCFDLQATLLDCYERAGANSLKCIERGFGSVTRVVGGACQQERDALFECEAPGIGICLNTCRAAQQEQFGDALQSPASRSVTEPSDAGGAMCPNLMQPCEDLCWLLQAYGGAFAFIGQLPSAEGGVGDASGKQSLGFPDILECFSSADFADAGAPSGQ